MEDALEWKCGISGLPIQTSAPSPEPAHRGRAESYPEYAAKESHAWNDRTVAAASQTGLYPLPGKPVPSYAQTGDIPADKGQNALQAKPYEQMQYPGQRVQVDMKVVPLKCLANPEERLYQYTAIDEYTRLSYLGAYPEQSAYSSADFLEKMVTWFKRRGVRDGIEFTNHFSTNKKDRLTRIELAAARLGIRHKLICPYTPHHNGKVERSHREDQKRFYNTHRFFSFADFGVQFAAHQNRSNDLPMRPLGWLSPKEKLAAFFDSLTVQDI